MIWLHELVKLLKNKKDMKEGSKVTIKDGSYMMTTKKGKISHIGAFDSTNTIGWNKETWTILCTGGVYPKDTNRDRINDIMIVNDVNGEVWFCSDINIKEVEQEPKFKVGDWVFLRTTVLGRVVKPCGVYPQCWSLDVDGNITTYNSCHEDYLRLATPSEIETHLIAEAKRRGYTSFVCYVTPVNKDKHKLSNNPQFGYHVSRGTEYLTDGWGGSVYEDGKWANIISNKRKFPKTKEELKAVIEDCVNRTSMSYDAFINQFE